MWDAFFQSIVWSIADNLFDINCRSGVIHLFLTFTYEWIRLSAGLDW